MYGNYLQLPLVFVVPGVSDNPKEGSASILPGEDFENHLTRLVFQ